MLDDQKAKLLIVDDLPENLQALSKIIEQDDRIIFSAQSGDEALALLLEHEFALAILDVMMPGMNGFELAELMRSTEKTRRIPIVFVSAGGRELNFAFKGYETGAVDFLHKPLDIAAVKSKVNVFVALYQQRNEVKRQLAILEENRRILAATKAELEHALQMRDDFMSLVAHELRTPLNTLYVETQLRQLQLERGDQQAFSAENLRAMINRDGHQIRSMIRLISDLLDVSRIKSGRLSIRPVETNLSELMQRVIDGMALQAQAAGCALQLSIQEGVVGFWDEFRVEQVVINLLTNAYRYGCSKPVEVTLKAQNGAAEICVRDQGIGIAPDAQEKIFQKFERLDAGNIREGLGMGLYIAKQLVCAHNGDILVHSVPGEGAEFRVILPLQSEAARMAAI
jgi:signal transduction histidine kinase